LLTTERTPTLNIEWGQIDPKATQGLRKGDRVSFRSSGATYNDAVGQIWPAGRVFDTCAIN